ncbi:hypothetical protein [Carboxylicivirga sp. N1Y90]|uniref:hypothetical protein n=1 Tax=Carboxylicivirga fragile TaxID=3417571 RepID=UPI003D33264C|nr:hypothetical protein [Marinilabiliaceae bacterium N1Y90]
MKIEIAESLVNSYLKHVEKCRLVQTNWATSGGWVITDYDKERAIELFEKIKQHPVFSEIFKGNSFEQLVKQAEIDVLGINVEESTVYGIDVAFHSAGLNYGGQDETCARLMKKIFRTVFIMQCYFSQFDKFHSYFVSPKVNPSVEKQILEYIDIARGVISDDSISIRLIANSDFYSEMVDPISKTVKHENDTTELFARALKLLQLDNRSKSNLITPIIPSGGVKVNSTKPSEDGMKIGQFVQYHMQRLFDEGKISDSEISNLLDGWYSKQTFNQDWSVLRKIEEGTKDDKGYGRYYSRNIYGGKYYLTSQWYDRHWEMFKSWLSNY